MKNTKASYLLPVFLILQTLLLAQDGGGGSALPTPNGVVLTQETVVREIALNYDSLLQTIDSASLYHDETLYIPVQYDENDNPIAYDYVTVKVKDEPKLPILYDTSEVLMALITLPKSDTLDIGRLFLKLGESSQTGYNLLDTAYQPSESSNPYEVIKAEEFTVIVINLGTAFSGMPSYYGQVVFQTTAGTMSAPYYFSATP